jgi:hypothetical protein
VDQLSRSKIPSTLQLMDLFNIVAKEMTTSRFRDLDSGSIGKKFRRILVVDAIMTIIDKLDNGECVHYFISSTLVDRDLESMKAFDSTYIVPPPLVCVELGSLRRWEGFSCRRRSKESGG